MNPYQHLPAHAFWRSAVGNKDMRDISGLWQPRFKIDRDTRIATFGSCFAQHFGGALAAHKFAWVDAEPPPPFAPPETRALFGYGQFSCRTGNIYTTSLLRQWLRWAVSDLPQPGEVWGQYGRVYDPFRPAIEPNGFASVAEMRTSRDVTVNALHRAVKQADIFVFTLGLTESWFHRADGFEYPICPGTVAGEFQPDQHAFRNQGYDEVWLNLRRALTLLRRARPGLRVVLTVSPVPLSATNSGQHVMVATAAAKSILRAVAETAVQRYDWVDYFPSYELITQPAFRGAFYDPNMRSVTADGVEFVMRSFFSAIGHHALLAELPTPAHDVQCEDEILAAFGPKGQESDD